MSSDVGNGWIERIRQLERRAARVEERIDRFEEHDEQQVIAVRVEGLTAQLAELRGEVRWLRRTIIGLASVIAAAAAIITQVNPG